MSIKVLTFGCRLNSYESEVMKKQAQEAGLDNAILVNTCAVTNEAVRQARQQIRRAKRDNPDAQIIVTGCAAQTESLSFAQMGEVDLVLGNDDKLKAESYKSVPNFGVSVEEKVKVNDIMSVRETALHLIEGLEGRARAFVQVQNGCDHRCTFCIIPYGRGNSRSVAMGPIIDQIRALVDNGYNEVVLTGVDITSYGTDLPGTPKFGFLVKSVLKHVPDLKRLRISSIDSIEADPDLMDCIANEDRLMPHLHLSLQAGDNMVLKRMKRRHQRDDTIVFCQQVRRLRPDMVFGADIIAGFPTETEDMFQKSLDIVEECDLTHLHVFPYSARPGTPAAKMPQVKGPVIKERAARLREVGDAALSRHLQSQIGRECDILVERNGLGRTEQFTMSEIANGEPGDIVRAKIVGATHRHLMADAIS
ncbi:MAG: tRNA (N(6)-L-threonylcarbamoyladenosine(37)-C(2))-methylthiotransferase MtaB [Cohaesibacter sp.]|nr:tRNA (N(6)-L-threonylcarbamoyladenosine(37)-C(2))-methylthiotransferase MtaB [Cohaesibacter sp.]MCV6601481.1 tRNA (N(6)-L-threonylcarbamoyladenosine(37)-C(2))-methylthiotransferase MtaB [Cohaesibacter sp.]